MNRKSPPFQKYIVYGIFLFVLFVFQTTPGALPRFFGVTPLLLIPAVVCISMFEGDAPGTAFGFAAGLFMDVNAVHMPGFCALILMLIGCVCGLFVANLMRNTVLSALTLSSAACFFYFLLHWVFFELLAGREQPLHTFLRYSFPNVVYTSLMTVPIYLLLRRIVRRQRKRKAAPPPGGFRA